MLYKKLRNLEKHKNRDSKLYREVEPMFEKSLNNLFDIVHKFVLNMIKINKNKEFSIL